MCSGFVEILQWFRTGGKPLLWLCGAERYFLRCVRGVLQRVILMMLPSGRVVRSRRDIRSHLVGLSATVEFANFARSSACRRGGEVVGLAGFK